MVGNGRCGIRIGMLAAVTVLAAGCSESAGEPTSTAPTTASSATTSSTVTTTAPPTTTTSTTGAPTSTTADPLARPDRLVSNFDRDSVDDFDTTGDDLYRIVLELDDLYNYFEGNPAETVDEMLGLLFTDDYPFLDYQQRAFGELVANGWHYVDAGIETVAVDVIEMNGDEATVRSATQRGDQLIADEEGAIAKVYDGWALDAGFYTLRRGDDGRWRIADVGESTRVSEPDLAAMVPVEWTGRAI